MAHVACVRKNSRSLHDDEYLCIFTETTLCFRYCLNCVTLMCFKAFSSVQFCTRRQWEKFCSLMTKIGKNFTLILLNTFQFFSMLNYNENTSDLKIVIRFYVILHWKQVINENINMLHKSPCISNIYKNIVYMR